MKYSIRLFNILRLLTPSVYLCMVLVMHASGGIVMA